VSCEPRQSGRVAPPAAQPETDESLAVRAGEGDVVAFDQLVRRFDRRVFNFLLRRGVPEGDAEDLVQDAFLEAWKSIPRYSPRWRFSTWLYTIASRQGIHLHRRRARGGGPGPSIDADMRPSREPAPPGFIITREGRENLWAIAERELTRDQAAALWLRYVDDFSIPEIARILGRASVTVRVILFRARQAMKEHLAAENRETESVAGVNNRSRQPEGLAMPFPRRPAPGATQA
jgi:RNA polymerase sigma-70 factor (ECF subfamily)